MSASPKHYRVYCYDAAHKIVTADWLDAIDDEAAIAAARELGFGTKCELWDGKRMVASLGEEDRKTA